MRRPWNLPDHPIYSLATYHADSVNMNICTYVTPVSMEPKLYAIAVYHGSRTLENLRAHPIVHLQLLRKPHILLINALGKRSGHTTDKRKMLQRKKMLDMWEGLPVLKECAAIVQLRAISAQRAGDHDLYLFETLRYKTFQDDQILMVSDLIKAGIILKK